MSRKIEYFSSEETDFKSELQYFSLAQDLRLAKYPIKRRCTELIKEYSRYILLKKTKMTKELIDEIDKLLVSKFNVLINEAEEGIKEGQLLNILLGLNQPDIRKACISFTKTYKRLLLTRARLNYIPRDIQGKLDENYKTLIGELRKLVFKPVLNLFSYDPEGLPTSIDPESELGKVLINEKPSLSQLNEMITDVFKKNNINADSLIENNQIIIKLNETV